MLNVHNMWLALKLNEVWPTVSIAAECGLGLCRGQIEVEVSCQVFDPHWWVFWKQGLTAGQLLLQVRNIQLKEKRENFEAVHSETNTSIMHRWYRVSTCDSLLGRRHNAALFLCVWVKIFIAFRGFAKPITFLFLPRLTLIKISRTHDKLSVLI